ncbi:HAMP domain-containing protein [Duganella sp. LX20W]|uniref:histidine kinase n=1 Tax=Rugamonas brunnea TaxID=2758569 RepID=A0A7W2ET24_9BURK|nr:ATP-binding protein [Rugamonas brunnea]MBA5638071.1 HAMP domain-containing protein [Rugamonas brunnea]
MRLTIARKIALAVIAIVILCIGTMAWVTSISLQRGFVTYLNEMQTQDLDQLRELLEARYRSEGDFEWLRHQPRALRSLLDQMKPRLQAETDDMDVRRRGPRGGRPDRPPPEAEDAPPEQDAPPPQRDGPGYGGADRLPGYGRPPPRAGLGPFHGEQQPARADLQPPRDDMPPPRADMPPPRAGLPPPRRPGGADPAGFASRISIVDAQGQSLIGPPDFPPGIERDIKVDGQVVGRMRLMPLRQAGGDASAATFLRGQLQTILLLSCALIGMAILAAIWLARHLLRPVAALRGVTEKLARGEFAARAPVLSRDELAELALHVNAMAQALEESEQQRRRMLADISHELRTPLTVIRGEIEALLDGIRRADVNALDSLHAEVLRLNQLVDDLHQLALADAGDLQYHWQQLDLTALLRPLLERYRLRAQQAGLTLTASLPDAPLTLTGDSGRLTQVCVNLLENSVRYTDSGGSIAVTLAADGAWAQLTVDDSAPGVPPGLLARLFDRLYRGDSARGRGGSGLGLAICKAMVEAHGGSIVALPSPLGGVRMLVRLPIHPSTNRQAHG